MSTIKQADAGSGAITITLASLATDSGLVAGSQSTAVSNASNLYTDYRIGGKITTGSSPTTGKVIEVWCYAAVNDTPLYPDSLTGSTGNVSVTSRDILAAGCRLIASIPTSSTSNSTYWFGPVSLASLWGGSIPTAFGIFVVHNTGVNLHATGGNHAIYQTGSYTTVV